MEGGGTVRTPEEARTVSSVKTGAVIAGTCSLVGTQLQPGRQRPPPLCRETSASCWSCLRSPAGRFFWSVVTTCSILGAF